MQLDQAIGHRFGELCQRIGEVFPEIDAMPLFDLAVVDAAMAHQRHDDVTAQAVIVAQLVAALHRQHALVEARVILR